MPRRSDINSILIIGSGPIIIGQGCEFDYSGVQACRALKEEGYKIILVNSNPATIMTDPDFSEVTYIEPINWKEITKIILKEKPDALLPTMGGQTALNCTLDLYKEGILKKYNIKLIGASIDAIEKAENRELFRKAMQTIGLEVPRSSVATSLEEAKEIQTTLGFPTIIRPSYTLGGHGGGIAHNQQEFLDICERGFAYSPIHTLLIEESLLGWKEFELEVVRDKNDNCIIVCTIENIDPMGIHTGDSITCAPAQTLTDLEYQKMRTAAITILREVGVETGGANVQFAVDPKNGRMLVIEMNPRVSRSSALASKATGFPIAKIAAKLAIGYTLDELKNDITKGSIPASFEPTLDYVVIKIPRFNFDKFIGANPILTTQMKSVGEVMALGRTFQESLQKALCSLEAGFEGVYPPLNYITSNLSINELKRKLLVSTFDRFFYISLAFQKNMTLTEINELTGIDSWFLNQIQDLVITEHSIRSHNLANVDPEHLFLWKQQGFSDKRLATLFDTSEAEIRAIRHRNSIRPVYKRVDSCAAEFPAKTAYLYSTYETTCESRPNQNPKIIVLGSGPNRIGQGIEFDYCCVHAIMAIREAGFETIMINCNPETVSTDYDISDRLYFEPLTLEAVLEIIDLEKPSGIFVHFGGQTPLKLVKSLAESGVALLGTSWQSIQIAEDRKLFLNLLNHLKLIQPQNGTAVTLKEGMDVAKKIGYPLILRPSFVLGGQAMKVVHNDSELEKYFERAIQVSDGNPILLDKFLENAIEVDVDAISDGNQTFIAGILEHLEPAGIHSGDSTCSLPPFSLSQDIQAELSKQVRILAGALQIVGPLNVQFALKDNIIYVLEVNPRVSRTMPFVAKSIGLPIAKIAALSMLGKSLKEQGIERTYQHSYFCVKSPVFSFDKFPEANHELGPEMKSTGEVMGIDMTFEKALFKSKRASSSISSEIDSDSKVYSLQELHNKINGT